jgi:hypothetical protein
MFRIDTATAVGTQPAIEPAGTPGYFQNAVPSVSAATQLDESFFNNLQEELINLLSLGDGEGVPVTNPDKAAQNQIKTHMELWVATVAGGGATTVDVVQATHGFAKYDVIGHNGTIYVKATADTLANSEVVGVVSDVVDASNFTYTTGGPIEWNVPATPDYTLGARLYLSTTVAGVITTTKPTTGVLQVLGTSTNEGLILEIDKGVLANPNASAPWRAEISKAADYTVLAADAGDLFYLADTVDANTTFTVDAGFPASGVFYTYNKSALFVGGGASGEVAKLLVVSGANSYITYEGDGITRWTKSVLTGKLNRGNG